MFVQFSRFVTVAAIVATLAACSSNDPMEAVKVEMAAAPQRAAALVEHSPAPTSVVAGSIAAAPQADGPRVTESERRAEELRMVDFEQSFSIEMNRRSQEQAEREQRVAVALRAGVVQGPGCEGTEGHAALECERSLL